MGVACGLKKQNIKNIVRTETNSKKKFEEYINGVLDEVDINVEPNSSCPSYSEFKKDGTFATIENDVNCSSTVDNSGTYVYNGTTLLITASAITDTLTVITLTNTDLSFSFAQTESDGSEYKSIVYFKKLN